MPEAQIYLEFDKLLKINPKNNCLPHTDIIYW